MVFNSSNHSTNWYRYCGREVDQDTAELVCYGGSCCGVICILIFSGVMLGMSIQDLQHDEIAVAYNNVTRELGTAVLAEGRHYLTPAHILLKFSNKLITQDQVISCISSDGLVMQLTTSFQFQPTRDEIRLALYEFGDQEFLTKVTATALRDIAKDLCGFFTGEQFFTNRSDIDISLSSNTSRIFAATPIHITVGFIQLKNIELPLNFSNAIQQKQLALEDIDVARIQREEIRIRTETEKIQAQQNASIIITQADFDAQAIQFQADSQANATDAVWRKRAEAFLFDMTVLNMTASEYVTSYLLPRVLADATNARIQACIQKCTAANCWYCWVEITPTPITV